MRHRNSSGLRVGVLAAMILLFIIPAVGFGGPTGRDRSWASIGLGVSPARYGSDRNGSLVATVAAGRSLSRRKSLVARLAYTRFAAHETTVLAPLTIGVRLHLSSAPDLEGGPYAEIGPVLCRASWHGRSATKSMALLGASAGVGTEIQVSPRTSLDWGAAIVMTADARDVWPDRLTRARGREGMARGYMYIGVKLRQ